MEKILFKDYPDTTTPIDADNLNLLQDNIEADINLMKEKVLYNDATGTTGTVTLSETSANFSYLEVFYGNRNKTGCASAKVYSPNGKGLDMAIHDYSTSEFPSGALYIAQTRANIAGTTITPAGASYSVFKTANVFDSQAFNNIYIYRVVGYR